MLNQFSPFGTNRSLLSGTVTTRLGFENYSLESQTRSRSINFPLHSQHHKKCASQRKRKQATQEQILEEGCTCKEFQYVKCGSPPPSDDTYEKFEEYTTKNDLAVQICLQTAKMNLLEHMKLCSGRHQLLNDIESRVTTEENLFQIFHQASKVEINIAFLWSALMKRWDLLDGFLKLEAQLSYFEPQQGLSALHLTAFSGCIAGTQFLITRGADVNACFKSYTPLHCAACGDNPETTLILLRNGARISGLNSDSNNCQEGVLHCAVRANATGCVRLLIEEGADVAEVEHTGVLPIHVAADMGHLQCLEFILQTNKVNVNVKTKEKEQTALHLAAEGGYVNCVELLLQKGADANSRNFRGETPLHLAARSQSIECVEMLLKKGDADPNIENLDKRTPLHAAVNKSTGSYDIVEVLVTWGAVIDAKDQYAYTPLHLAAMNELSHCVEFLIFHGADVTAKSKFGTTALGMMIRKTPASLAIINRKLDGALVLYHNPESTNREAEMRMDFRNILQHCHPKEIGFLSTFVDEGHKDILLHPLCSAFLHLKWQKIRKFYIAKMLFCFIFVLSLSLYVLTALAHNCYNYGKNVNSTDPISTLKLCENKSILAEYSRNNPFFIELQWYILVGIVVCEIVRKIYGVAAYPTFKQYTSYPENIIDWFVIVSVFLISCVYTSRTYMWQNHIAAFAVLLAWTKLLFMVGQLPVFGVYVAMYTKILSEFAKLLLAYSCLIVGFAISFCIIFPESNMFSNPFISLISILVIMTGESNLDLLVKKNGINPSFFLGISAQIAFVLLLIFLTIILMNLLVGIAVHDIQGLQKTAELSKLMRQTKLISYMEQALFNGCLPKCIQNLLQTMALVSPKAYRVVLNLKPLNPHEKRLPRDILDSAYKIAKRNKNRDDTMMSNCNSTPATWMKWFKSLDKNSEESLITISKLQKEVDESSSRIENLRSEVKELKGTLADTHKLAEQLLIMLTEKSSNC